MRQGGGGDAPRGTRVPAFSPAEFVRLKIIDAIDANLRLFIRYGKHTFADVGVRFLADVRIGNALSYAVGAGGIAYGARQRKLRGDTIQKMGDRIKELETAIDPNRSSSGLTKRGHTRPEDEL